MGRLWKTIKAIVSDILWLAFGVLICIALLIIMAFIAYCLYELINSGWLFDGSNPRFES